MVDSIFVHFSMLFTGFHYVAKADDDCSAACNVGGGKIGERSRACEQEAHLKTM